MTAVDTNTPPIIDVKRDNTVDEDADLPELDLSKLNITSEAKQPSACNNAFTKLKINKSANAFGLSINGADWRKESVALFRTLNHRKYLSPFGVRDLTNFSPILEPNAFENFLSDDFDDYFNNPLLDEPRDVFGAVPQREPASHYASRLPEVPRLLTAKRTLPKPVSHMSVRPPQMTSRMPLPTRPPQTNSRPRRPLNTTPTMQCKTDTDYGMRPKPAPNRLGSAALRQYTSTISRTDGPSPISPVTRRGPPSTSMGKGMIRRPSSTTAPNNVFIFGSGTKADFEAPRYGYPRSNVRPWKKDHFGTPKVHHETIEPLYSPSAPRSRPVGDVYERVMTTQGEGYRLARSFPKTPSVRSSIPSAPSTPSQLNPWSNDKDLLTYPSKRKHHLYESPQPRRAPLYPPKAVSGRQSFVYEYGYEQVRPMEDYRMKRQRTPAM
ncbi:hypothetical protein BZG36_03920 [Bifiguratus adelaidae]|uniref:Uncharacterized protein n=1 Tax=Bifiguratus adelaidae TaxID=1938954 RepID=A0A261XZ79_9FUNG|nr:hypothetical protein BZG36_03920 [Bifiguratus adelaidae]